ncbi:hypothetical protein [Flavobacterium sp. '19STA2R22 D10 B1']|uniref:hypothetical protein n=1 Tax=Flavobacterium aerium TaxID=3037261 RepID=UPI00278BED8C|nr:hypothetical protein [Flavobacterium sp. '19STA2R22 D10 B1']
MPTDLTLNEFMDLEIVNGDFVISESTYQNQKLLIIGDKGEWKENPMRGVGAKRYLETSSPDELARELRLEFIADGMIINKIEIKKNLEIQVDAYYP